jgi:hypothetical protein
LTRNEAHRQRISRLTAVRTEESGENRAPWLAINRDSVATAKHLRKDKRHLLQRHDA